MARKTWTAEERDLALSQLTRVAELDENAEFLTLLNRERERTPESAQAILTYLGWGSWAKPKTEAQVARKVRALQESRVRMNELAGLDAEEREQARARAWRRR